MFFSKVFVCELGFCEGFCWRVRFLRGVLFVSRVVARRVVCESGFCETFCL